MLNANTIPQDGKRVVLCYPADFSGCSHYRLRWDSLYFNGFDCGFDPIISRTYIWDFDILAMSKAIIFQRPINFQTLNIVKRYKSLQPKFGYKLVFETDDILFKVNGEGLPDYNTAHYTFPIDESYEVLKQSIHLYDQIIVSTDYLKKIFEETFNVHNVYVRKNVLPRFLWNYPRREHIESDLVKPRIMYTASPCHYLNRQEINGKVVGPLIGDWRGDWVNWIIDNVKQDKIEFTIMGTLPYFFNEIQEQIRIIPWVECNTYPRMVLQNRCDISIAPLIDNLFNRCKSALRFYESCASGMAFIGGVFDDNKFSPYEECLDIEKISTNATYDTIDKKIWEICKKDNFNKILDQQYDLLNSGNLWNESEQHLNDWLCMISGNEPKKLI